MTTGFQQQQSQAFSFPRAVRQPQHTGRKLDAAPPAPTASTTAPEARSFK